MKAHTLLQAVKDAKNFIKKAEELLEVDALDERNQYIGYGHPKETGALRRSSMDLTRKLADLRQGR